MIDLGDLLLVIYDLFLGGHSLSIHETHKIN
jgi:hypothetical protein